MAYNKFRWWITGRIKKPLPPTKPLLDRIRNGDFEYSPYFEQAESYRKLSDELFDTTLKNSKSNKFTKGLKEKFSDFSREEFIVEDNVAILRDIVKRKQAKPIKLKDGQMKVDGYTASAFVQTLDNKKMKPDTKKKLEFIINKGTKSQFLRTVDAVFR